MAKTPKPDPTKKDFFISYNHNDSAWAEWIAWQLENAGYSVIIQAWDFHPGKNFILEMQDASVKALHTMPILSPNYLSSKYCAPEWAAKFAVDPTGEKRSLIPVRIAKCEPEGLLGPIVYIDLLGLDPASAKKALLAGVKKERGKPDAEPPFPTSVPDNEPRFPGSMPPIWNIPHQRNPNFTGRKKLLDGLRKALSSGESAALTQAIKGLGGVGKTQLALEYVYRHAADYEIVWWIRAEDPATLAGDYAALAVELEPDTKTGQDQRLLIKFVRVTLEHATGWLLIFDNVPKPEQVHEYLPHCTTGHVIITSRHHAWGGVAAPLSVEVMEEKDAVDFLLKRTGQQDKTAAAKLAEALGHLPLALEQAGAYIEEKCLSYAEYLARFNEQRKEILKRGKPSGDYPYTVATTWEMSFAAVKDQSPAGADLLNLCAFFAPDDIPLELIRSGAKFLPPALAKAVTDDLAFDEAIAALLHYSLVQKNGNMLSVHRLVQAVVHERLPQAQRKKWAAAAVETINNSLALDVDTNLEAWPVYQRLLPHALASAKQLEAIGSANDATARVLHQVAIYLKTRASYQEAKSAFERALKIGEATVGPNHPKVATTVNNLGLVLYDLGDLAGAQECYERALKIDEVTYGPDHPRVAIDVNNLGLVLQDLGDLPGARECYERALKIDEVTYGPDHPRVATDVNNLGSVLQYLGDLPGARECCERALRIDETTYELDHPAVAIDVNNLGLVLQDLGDLPGARECLERMLKILETVHGMNHPYVATAVNNLGGVLLDLGDLQGARECAERALKIFQQVFGDDHPRTRMVRRNLAALDAEISVGARGRTPTTGSKIGKKRKKM